MNVSSTTMVSGATGNPRKAAILKQIRNLEAKKQELLEKMKGGSGSSGSTSAAGTSQGTYTVNAGKTGGDTTGADSVGFASETSAMASSLVAGGGIDVQSIGQNLQDFKASLGAGAGGVPEIKEDPKDIMKRIQLIELQIMTLRQQLGDDAQTVLSMEDDSESEGEKAVADFVSGLLGGAAGDASLPAVEVTADGHVDGYM